MRIGIDLTTSRSYQGIEVYSENLTFALIENFPEHTYFIFKGAEVFPDFDIRLMDANNVRIINFKRLRNSLGIILQQQILLPFLVLRHKINFLVSFSVFFSFFAAAKKIITAHDCAYIRHDKFRNFFSMLYINTSIFLARYLCSKIATVSEFSRQELTDIYRFKKKDIIVIPGGVPNLPLVTDKQEQAILNSLNLMPSAYFFYIGITKPRKNIPGLLKAFKIFSDQAHGLLGRNLEYKLVLAGKIDTSFINVFEQALRLGLHDKLVQLGFINNSQKTALYKNAAALMLPSFYEGFGLPVLEAQSLGVPVIASNRSALPEIAGQGALFVNPENPAEIAAAMAKIVSDPALRSDLVRKGKENLERFNWNRSARNLIINLDHENSAGK